MTFKEKIYEISKNIPKGKVATYKQLAELAGNAKASRAVGMCMRTNPYAPEVPCHRVVASDGGLKGFSAGKGLITKREMLESEGITFTGNRIDLSKYQWKPNLV